MDEFQEMMLVEEPNILKLFDMQFSVTAFAESIAKTEAESNEIILKMKKILRETAADDDKKKYYLDLSEEVRDALDRGQAEFIQGSNGDVYAQLRGTNGEFGPKIPIKEEMDNNDITYEELQMAIQNEAIAEQLKNIIGTLKEIELQISETKESLRNDRIGLFYSGLSIYIEATQVTDNALQKLLISQAIKAFSDSQSQMIQEIRTSIEFLSNGQYKNRKKSVSLIDENLQTIKQCYEIVFKSALMKAKIYHDIHEIRAMAISFEEFGRFINKMISPYVGILSELDKDSLFISKGPWGQISNTLVSCNSIIEKLTMKESLQIEMRDSNG